MRDGIQKDRTMTNRHCLVGIMILGTGFAGACSSSGGGAISGQGGTGVGALGGTASGGATVAGGAPGSGGSAISGGGLAGSSGNGGVARSGGSASSGGVVLTGGAARTGGTATSIGTGGIAASGGVIGAGGTASTGGAVGGAIGTGGTTGAKGGVTGTTGGATGSGGIAATGGGTGAGGIAGTGGRTGAGGSTLPSGPALAFPGAVGFGKKATGGRGYAVYHVTNLSDTGTGSFRDAVSAGNRIVVFDVGGYVVLQTAVSVKSDLTIAGQTAPGDGIGFMAKEVSFNAASNVIVRHVRFRQGMLDTGAAGAKKSGINLLDGSNLIFDHVSIEFAQYDSIDAVGATNITVMNSIVADPTGQQFGAHTEMTGGFFSWYGNLWANAHGRQPLAKSNTQFVNNVVYNYGYAYCAGDTSGVFWHDIINNYFIAGPSTTSAGDDWYQMNSGQTVYVKGNLLDSDKDGTLNGTDAGSPGGTTKANAANSTDTATMPTTSAADTYATVVAGAGASLHRDQVDSLVVADTKSLGKSGQLWTDQTATGLTNSGYGTLAGGTAPVDTDKDGMPDAWETKYGLNPNDPSDATGDFDKTGYTNIEKYINGIVDGLYP
jgi:hypothetical protein